MLPRRYKTRFGNMGTFTTLAADGSMLDYQEFADCLDVFVCNICLLLRYKYTLSGNTERASTICIMPQKTGTNGSG